MFKIKNSIAIGAIATALTLNSCVPNPKPSIIQPKPQIPHVMTLKDSIRTLWKTYQNLPYTNQYEQTQDLTPIQITDTTDPTKRQDVKIALEKNIALSLDYQKIDQKLENITNNIQITKTVIDTSSTLNKIPKKIKKSMIKNIKIYDKYIRTLKLKEPTRKIILEQKYQILDSINNVTQNISNYAKYLVSGAIKYEETKDFISLIKPDSIDWYNLNTSELKKRQNIIPNYRSLENKIIDCDSNLKILISNLSSKQDILDEISYKHIYAYTNSTQKLIEVPLDGYRKQLLKTLPELNNRINKIKEINAFLNTLRIKDLDLIIGITREDKYYLELETELDEFMASEEERKENQFSSSHSTIEVDKKTYDNYDEGNRYSSGDDFLNGDYVKTETKVRDKDHKQTFYIHKSTRTYKISEKDFQKINSLIKSEGLPGVIRSNDKKYEITLKKGFSEDAFKFINIK